jgi:hypothetical protein
MKKKLSLIFAIIALLAVFSLGFTACGGDTGGEETCPPHTWGEWTVTKAATETEDGSKERTCTKCGEKEKQAIPKTGSGDIILPDGIYLNDVATTWDEAFASIRAGGAGTSAAPKTYTIGVYGTHAVPGIVSLTSSTGFGENNEYVSVTLNGNGKLYLTSRGNIVVIGARQTLIIDGANLVLEGLREGQNGATQDNNDNIIYGRGNSTLELKNGTITGNSGGRAVYSGGTFNMSGGKITNNASGGVGFYGSTFTLSGGEISGNSYTSWMGGGAGVYIGEGAVFNMTGGKISGNTTNQDGGGVLMSQAGALNTFTMSGGEISGNSADGAGGGLFFLEGVFVKQGGGIFYGNDASSDKQNISTSKSFTHAIGTGYNNYNKYRNTTLGVNDNIVSRESEGWFE